MRVRLPGSWKGSLDQPALGWEPFDALQSLDYLDQCGHASDFVEGWSLQLGQQCIDLLLGGAIKDRFDASRPRVADSNTSRIFFCC